MGIFNALLAVIALNGATAENLKVRAYFDANNVRVGDPMTLTIDFLGKADFASLHPPALSRAVDRKVWKIDDASAKTQTSKRTVSNLFNSWEVPLARTLTYRVRPMKEGVLWFPGLEFEYEVTNGGTAADGELEKRTVKTSPIPVHAVRGAEVVVAEMGEDREAMPMPDDLITAPTTKKEPEPLCMWPVEWTDDLRFAWKRACLKPTADAFAEFDFGAAKLNEARCAILDGNWARAMKVYSRLEWRIGQTPAIERGILAALAVKAGSNRVELPVWRQVGRPLLRYAWPGRVGILLGGFAAVLLVLWLLRRAIKALACVAILLAAASLPSTGFAQGFFNFSFPGMERMERIQPARVVSTIAVDRGPVKLGETFRYLITLESPLKVTLEGLQLQASEMFGLRTVGNVEMTEEKIVGSNVVRRLEVPVRYDVPFKGLINFTISGMQTQRISRGNFSSTSSTSFSTRTQDLMVEVRPLDGAPADFSGIVTEHLRYMETPDLREVASNDVVTITCRLDWDGFVPESYAPPGVAFEWRRGQNSVEWKKYFVADGSATLPQTEIVYYEPTTCEYRRVKGGGGRIRYREVKSEK